jgi:tripartite-type tricarboxylate transporter receptor subunit TctC
MPASRFALRLAASLLAVPAALASLPALAQAYPSRTITVISNLGGAIDTPVRLVLDRIKQNTGANAILEPRPGANGALGLTPVRRAQSDGYTIAWTYASALTLNPLMTKGLDFEAKDFTPITALVQIAPVIAVKGDHPASSLRDLIDQARKAPESVKIGYSGAGTHVNLLLLQENTGVKFLLVPYKTNAEGIAGTLGGITDAHVDTVATILAQAGKLKAVSYGASPRSSRLPNVPSLREVVPGMDMVTWFGIVGPAGMPADVVGWLHREMVRALRDPQVTEGIAKAGFDLVGNSPAELAATINAEVTANRTIATKFNLGG